MYVLTYMTNHSIDHPPNLEGVPSPIHHRYISVQIGQTSREIE